MTHELHHWRQVAERLRDAIEEGRFAPGAQLPTQAVLADTYHASRHAVRRALAELERDQLVESWQGKGTFIRGDHVEYAIGPGTRFSDNLAAAGLEPSGQVIRANRIPAPDDVASLLNIPVGTDVLMAELLRYANGAPIMLSRHHVEATRFPKFLSHVRETRSVTKALRRCGVASFTRTSTTIQTRVGTEHETDQLQISPGQPVLVTCGRNVDCEEQPVEVSISVSRGDRVTFAVAAQP